VPPQNGLIIFCGAVITGNNQTRQEYTIIEPLEPIQTYFYRCGSKFETESIKEMLIDKDTYGLLVLDLHEASWGILHGTRIESVTNITSLVPSKQGRGGQSAQRYERLRDVAINDFFTKVGERVSNTFLAIPDFHKVFKGIIIGGSGPTKDTFMKGSYLNHEIKKKIISIHNVGYTDESGLRELVDNAKDDLANVGLVREKKMIDEVLKEIGRSSGMATYGIEHVKKSLESGAIAILLLSDDLPSEIIEDLTEKAMLKGIDVEMISSSFESGNILKTAFGGVVALNRYRHCGR